jgi:hypothetical protein
MSGGGHYEWDQGINPSAWRQTIKTLISRLKTRHSVAFLCHNENEYCLAQDLHAMVPCLWPKTPQEYIPLVSGAKLALCNRMHASVALAGLGIPSVAVCTDTRLLMIDAIGLPYLYVKEAEVEHLEDVIENLIVHRRQERERLLALRTDTWNRYVQTVAEVVH